MTDLDGLILQYLESSSSMEVYTADIAAALDETSSRVSGRLRSLRKRGLVYYDSAFGTWSSLNHSRGAEEFPAVANRTLPNVGKTGKIRPAFPPTLEELELLGDPGQCSTCGAQCFWDEVIFNIFSTECSISSLHLARRGVKREEIKSRLNLLY